MFYLLFFANILEGDNHVGGVKTDSHYLGKIMEC